MSQITEANAGGAEPDGKAARDDELPTGTECADEIEQGASPDSAATDDMARLGKAILHDTARAEDPLVQTRRQAKALIEQGRLDDAAATLRALVDKDSSDALAWHDLGAVLAKQGRISEAVHAFERALVVRPDAADTRRNLGVALTALKRYQEAEDSFRRAVELDPGLARAHQDWAGVLKIIGKRDDAVARYREAIRLNAASSDAHHDLGLLLAELKRPVEAEASYREALRLRPDFPEAHNNLGILLENLGNYDAAIAQYRAALRIRPQSADVHNNLGVALAAKRDYEEAVASYRRALAITPDSALALNNLGNSLRALGDVNEAETSLRRAIRLRPDYAEAYNNLGIALVQQARDDEAVANYNRALAFRPDYPEAHLNRALAWLARGEFERGWTEYEWRWKGRDVNRRSFRQRPWDGSPARGRAIFIYLEQGVGDTLQFIRYAALVKHRGATVIVEAPRHLMSLLASCTDIDELIQVGDAASAFDHHVALLSLPGLLGTTVDTVPGEVPYLRASQSLVDEWKGRLAEVPGFRVGISWQGNPQYRGDRQRSIPLRHFAGLARVGGVRLINLQKGFGCEQLRELSGDFSVVDLGTIDEEAGAFMDTAAIMANLDLLITSDSAVAHLAGALGVPVWMALPYVADWRWMRSGSDSPWYPTMRIFRQRRPGDWEGLFDEIAGELWRRVSRGTERANAAGPAADEAEASHKKGLSLAKEGKWVEAQHEFRLATERNPALIAAHQNLGVALAQTKQIELAIRSFEKATQLDPDFADAHGNLGLAHYEQGRFIEAAKAFRRALRAAPGSAETLNNLGATLMQLGRVEEAARIYRRSLELRPEYAEAHLNLARALLTSGDLEHGWIEHEWRSLVPAAASREKHQAGSGKPRWNGSPLGDRSLLLRAEQGLGDTLQFVRFAAEIKRIGGGRVIVECQPALARLLRLASGVDVVVPAGQPVPDHDVQAALMSVPAFLGVTLATIPSTTSYLSADPKLARQWSERLGSLRGCKVGIAWQGNPDWPGDRYRSIPLRCFETLGSLGDVQMISLQKGPGAEQLASAGGELRVIDYGGRLDREAGPFMDTAAIMQSLDLVVTSDTSIAHLAGALGIDVWVALPFAADWRWLTERTDSPWYPTMRLFRQPATGDWKSVFQSIGRALRMRLASRRILEESSIRASASNIAVAPQPVTNVNGSVAEVERSSSAVRLNLTCPLNQLGYGVVGVNLLKALDRAEIEVACWPIGPINASEDDQALIQRAIDRQANFDGRAASLRLSQQDQLAQHTGTPRIGFPIFELDRFTAREVNHLQSQDLLFVASHWARDVVEANRVFPRRDAVQVVPLGVDRRIFHEAESRLTQNGTPTATIFLSVGKWERRKGHDVLLDAFNKAFSKSDHVELWVLHFNPVLASGAEAVAAKNKQWEDRFTSSPLGDRIKVLPRVATQMEVAQIMRQADCGVFLSRAEGWNLPALEMLACGKRIIITNYSAHTEYCDAQNALLIEIDGLEDAVDDRWFFRQGQWAALGERQVEQAANLMRQVHAQKQREGRLGFNAAGIATSHEFSWDRCARRALDAIKRL